MVGSLKEWTARMSCQLSAGIGIFPPIQVKPDITRFQIDMDFDFFDFVLLLQPADHPFNIAIGSACLSHVDLCISVTSHRTISQHDPGRAPNGLDQRSQQYGEIITIPLARKLAFAILQAPVGIQKFFNSPGISRIAPVADHIFINRADLVNGSITRIFQN
ncbi:Uncharacterised protein [uncultured archaeon]|nr:Uncharacterised protein [uncultured archaeon]